MIAPRPCARRESVGVDACPPAFLYAPSENEHSVVTKIPVNVLDGPRRLVLFPVACLVRVWGWTWRIDASAEEERLMRDVSEPTILLFWHNRLLLGAECHRRFRAGRSAYGLVSASKDGAWLAAFFELIGLGTVRGSSSRRGSEALQELVEHVREGSDVALTPDGPRGPVYSFKPGAAILARRSGARILLASAECSSAWRVKSWDRFFIPKPFSRVKLRCRMLHPRELPDDLTALAERLKEELSALGAG